MAIRTKTIEYAFETYTDKIATTNNIATTGRVDFSSLSIEIPETTSRIFRSCMLVITWSDAYTVSLQALTVRMGITINGVTNDADFVTGGIAATGDPEGGFFTRDVTAQFTANFGAGTSQTIYPSFAMSTSSSSFMTNFNAKLIITYDFSDTGETTLIKTVKIGIQSSTGVLAANTSLIGDSGDSPALDDAIPALDTFLPEASKSFKRAWLEVVGQDAGADGVVTSYALTATFGSGTNIIRSNITRSLSGGAHYTDYITYDLTGSYPTSASQAVRLGAGIANRFIVSLALCVTYTYNPTLSTRSINFCELTLHGVEPGYVLPGVASNNAFVYTTNFLVNEPGPIKLERSTVNLYLNSPAASVVSCSLGGQAYRGYSLPATVWSSPFMISQRGDINSGWTLQRGMNTLKTSIFATTNRAVTCTGGKIYLLYTSSIAPSGTETHNKTIVKSQMDMSTSGAITANLIYTASGPTLPESTSFYINQVGVVATDRTAGTVSHIMAMLAPQVMPTDTFASGYKTYNTLAIWDGELGTSFITYDMTDIYNRTSYETGSLVLSTNRNWLFAGQSSCNFQSWMYVTYNSITYPVSGTIVSSAGGTVNLKIYRRDDHIASGSRTGNGTYSIDVFNPTELLVVTARESSALVGSSDEGASSP